MFNSNLAILAYVPRYVNLCFRVDLKKKPLYWFIRGFCGLKLAQVNTMLTLTSRFHMALWSQRN